MKKKFLLVASGLLTLLLLSNSLIRNVQAKELSKGSIFAATWSEDGKEEYVYYNTLQKKFSKDVTVPAYIPADVPVLVQPDAIFGTDDRTKLTEEQYTQFPYRAVCLLFMHVDTNKNGKRDDTDATYVGTGTLVGPSTILTASHVIYSNQYGWLTTDMEIIPGGHKNAAGAIVAPYGIATHIVSASRGVNAETNNTNDDWAIITFSEKFYDLGYFGYSSTLSEQNSVRLYGYHGDYDCRLGYGPGKVTYLETYKFYHNCDAISGSSGGPVTTGTTTIVGIHSGGVDSDQDAACKVSPILANWIKEAADAAHTHSYTNSYQWTSGTKHESYCICGEHVSQGHVVSGGGTGLLALPVKQYCLLCKGVADIGFIQL